MIILGLNGSPHRHGNTAALLRIALEAAEELGARTEVLFIQEIMEKLDKPYCTACSSPCTGKCYRGTELEQALARLGEADGILMASPVYFGTVSAQLKSFWDKTRRLRGEKRLLNVAGGAISSGGSRFGGQETTLRALHSMMLIQGMLIVGDCYDEKAPGHHGVCSQQPTQDDAYALKRAVVLGKRVAQVCLATEALRLNRPLGKPSKK